MEKDYLTKKSNKEKTFLGQVVGYLALFSVIFVVISASLFSIDFYPELVYTEQAASEEERATSVANEAPTVTLTARVVPVTLASAEVQPEAEDTRAVLGNSSNATRTVDPVARMEAQISDALKPQRIIIEKIGIDVAVKNPATRDIDALDGALLGGAVRFPGSGSMSAEGNMFIFGHSSSLPAIRNQNFKAFNNIGTLAVGDIIRVRSGTIENVYQVSSVRMDAASNIRIDFTTEGKKLTLSTCNSFGSKQDRYIVEADFVGSYPLANLSS